MWDSFVRNHLCMGLVLPKTQLFEHPLGMWLGLCYKGRVKRLASRSEERKEHDLPYFAFSNCGCQPSIRQV